MSTKRFPCHGSIYHPTPKTASKVEDIRRRLNAIIMKSWRSIRVYLLKQYLSQAIAEPDFSIGYGLQNSTILTFLTEQGHKLACKGPLPGMDDASCHLWSQIDFCEEIRQLSHHPPALSPRLRVRQSMRID